MQLRAELVKGEMPERFVIVDRQTPMFLPPDLREWVAENDLVRLILEAVEQTDLSVAVTNVRGSGSLQYPPGMMLALLIYCYARGWFSSRQIEQASFENVAARYLCANTHPDHDTIAKFRRENRALFESCFCTVLSLARELGLVRLGAVAIDGTRLAANASGQKFRTHDQLEQERQAVERLVQELLARAEAADQLDEDGGGTQLPPELADAESRRQKIKEAMARIKEREREQKAKETKRGRKSDAKEIKVNLSDLDAARLPRQGKQTVIGYNAQVAVEVEGAGLIVGATVSNQTNDHELLGPVLEQIPPRVGQPQEVIADSGYENGQAVAELENQNPIKIYYPPRRIHNRSSSAATRLSKRDKLRAQVRCLMQQRIDSERGQQLLQLRKIWAEGCFATIRGVLGFQRFRLRGLFKVQTEWLLVCLGFNLRKLARA